MLIIRLIWASFQFTSPVVLLDELLVQLICDFKVVDVRFCIHELIDLDTMHIQIRNDEIKLVGNHTGLLSLFWGEIRFVVVFLIFFLKTKFFKHFFFLIFVNFFI